MANDDHELVQDLRVAAAVVTGQDVVVSVYGGARNVCGTVRFTFDDADERRTTAELARRWAATDQLVTLLASNGSVSLFVERDAFEDAAAPTNG